ncbi:MAG: glycosyltransferase family 2 protein [Janthinobacterium lividum]
MSEIQGLDRAVTPDPGVVRLADVTVVMPAKDRETLIGRALDSIDAQSVRPRETIVVDDGSSDDTAGIARAHGASVIRLNLSGGSGPARNLGIEAAGTRWIAFLDSDDAWDPDHLERTLAALEDHGASFVMAASPGRSAGGVAGRIQGNSWPRDVMLTPMALLAPGDLVCTSGTLVRRDALISAGLFRPLRRAQDLDMWVRVLEQGSGIALSHPTVTYYLHGAQASNDKHLMRECFDRIVEDVSHRPWFTAKDYDRCYARVRWDDMREAQAARGMSEFIGHVLWFARRPHTFPPLVRLLRQRRLSRRRVRESEVGSVVGRPVS